MEITRAEAETSLGEIEQAVAQTRRVISSGIAAPLLMLWGVICIAAFGATYAWPGHEKEVWFAGDGVGLFATVFVCWWKRRRGAVLSERAQRLWARLYWFSILLTAYGFIFGALMTPQSDRQIAAFTVILVMFGYVVIGLWLDSGFMLALGLVVTALTLAGYLQLTETFNLWMAVAGGGALFTSGLYMRLKWS